MKNREKQIKVLYCVMVLFILAIITLIVMIACAPSSTATPSQNTSVSTNSVEETEEPRIVIYYQVQPGDTWWDLSRQFYGDGSYYEAIAIYNKCSPTEALYVEDIITIPDKRDRIFISIINGLEAINSEKVKEFNQSMSGKVIQAYTSNSDWYYGKFNFPAVPITIPDCNGSMKNYTGYVDTSNFHLIGQYKITGYTPQCYHCCESTAGIGAAGSQIICGYSVAAPWDLPYGTTLYIEGYGFYVVEDRGNLGENTIDIACPTHDQCYDITKNDVNVYIVGIVGGN